MISQMTVMWVTQNDDESVVNYGKSADGLHLTASGRSSTYTFGGWLGFIHTVTLVNLTGDSKYFYKVGGQKFGFSETFNFRTMPNRNVTRFAVIGDMGVDPEAEPNIDILTDLVKKEAVDVVVHAGDIAYADGYQARWDQYFRRVQPMLANIPYMVAPGNHEIMYINSIGVFGYDRRFLMPSVESGSPSPLYYSWNYGAVHFIALNSESNSNVAKMPKEQVAWLVNDLKKVNRQSQPWVVVYLHRPLYCSNIDIDNCHTQAKVLRTAIEGILLQYNVNLVVTAHKHGYERTTPLYNDTVKPEGKAPVYIVNGAGGNREGTAAFPAIVPAWAVIQKSEWGYGIIEASLKEFVWTFTTSSDNKVVDKFAWSR